MDTTRAIFFAGWVLLAAGGFYLFAVNREVGIKRRLFPWFTLLVGILFVLYVIYLGFSLPVLLFIIPAAVLLTCFNLLGTKFCDVCGSMVRRNTPFAKIESCPKCGARMDST